MSQVFLFHQNQNEKCFENKGSSKSKANYSYANNKKMQFFLIYVQVWAI